MLGMLKAGKGKAGCGCCMGTKGSMDDVHGGSLPSLCPWERARQLL